MASSSSSSPSSVVVPVIVIVFVVVAPSGYKSMRFLSPFASAGVLANSWSVLHRPHSNGTSVYHRIRSTLCVRIGRLRLVIVVAVVIVDAVVCCRRCFSSSS